MKLCWSLGNARSRQREEPQWRYLPGVSPIHLNSKILTILVQFTMTQQNLLLLAGSREMMGKPSQDQSGKNIRPHEKKKKRSSPFRIKVGCTVALRYRPGGNHVAIQPESNGSFIHLSAYCGKETPFTDVWSKPQPGRDEGLNLMGCRVRCCFSKTVMSNSFHSQRASSRMVEGEVVSIVNSAVQFREQRHSHRRREAHGTTVGTWTNEASR